MNNTPLDNKPNLDTTPCPDERLSAHGCARSQAMLGLREDAVRARGQRRRALRKSLIMCGIILAGWTLVLASKPTTRFGSGSLTPTAITNPTTTPTAASTNTPNTPASHRRVARLVTYVVNDKDIVAKLAGPSPAIRIELLNDTELLAQLKLAGLPAGIIRRKKTLTLAFHNAPLPSKNAPYPSVMRGPERAKITMP